jgi:hypothetical protein
MRRAEKQEHTTQGESQDSGNWSPDKARKEYLVLPQVKAVAKGKTLVMKKRNEKKLEGVLKEVSSRIPLGKWLYKGRTALDRLKLSLERFIRGDDRDLVNPIFGKRAGDGKLYLDRKALMGELYSCIKPSVNLDVVHQLEEAQLKDVASRSISRPWAEVEDLAENVFHFVPMPSTLKPLAKEKATEALRSWFPVRQIPTKKIEDVYSKSTLSEAELQEFYADNGYTPMDTTTSSGPQYYLPAWCPTDHLKEQDPELFRVVSKVHDDLLTKARDLRAQITTEGEKTNATLWSQLNKRVECKGEGDPKKKSLRLVQGVEKTEPLLAKTLTIGLMDYAKRIKVGDSPRTAIRPFAGLLGQGYVDANVKIMLETANAAGRTILAGDISGYDTSQSQELNLYLAEAFKDVFMDPSSSELYHYLQYVVHMRLGMVTPYKVYWPQPCTRASGSGFTLWGNTKLLMWALLYGHYADAYRLRSAMVLGDDFLADADGISPLTVSDVMSECGLDVSPQKQFFEKGFAEFLQRLYTPEHDGGIYSVTRCISRMASPETALSTAAREMRYISVIRALGQLRNIEFHPAFIDVVNFVKEHDKYNLHAEKTYEEIVQSAGPKAEDVIRERYKGRGHGLGGVPGAKSLANRVRMGDLDIPDVKGRFPLVYGGYVEDFFHKKGDVYHSIA